MNFGLINKAIYWARKYHGDQKRLSGEQYYTHPLEVAYLISEYNLTTNVIATSIMHDLIEDTEVTAGMLVDNFGFRIAEMVDILTRDRPDGTKVSVEDNIKMIYKRGDNEVMLIRLVYRFHNIITISSKSPEKINKTSKKTIDEFIALAMYLEVPEVRDKLLKICIEARNKTGSKIVQNKFSFVKYKAKLSLSRFSK